MTPKLEQIVAELSQSDRQERIELLIDFARSLPALPDQLVPLKDAAHRVEECQTPVFLFVERHGDRLTFYADVPIESPTVRGFLSLLIEGLNGATIADVLELPNNLIEQLGLPEILGMQRMRGLHAVLRRVKAEASRAALAQTAETPAPPAGGAQVEAELPK